MANILKSFKGFRPFTIFTEWGLAQNKPVYKVVFNRSSVWLLRNIFPLLQFNRIMHPYLIPILKTLANSNSSCNCSWPGSVVTFLKCLLLMGVKLWNGFCRVVGAITGRRHPPLLTPPPPTFSVLHSNFLERGSACSSRFLTPIRHLGINTLHTQIQIGRPTY